MPSTVTTQVICQNVYRKSHFLFLVCEILTASTLTNKVIGLLFLVETISAQFESCSYSLCKEKVALAIKSDVLYSL